MVWVSREVAVEFSAKGATWGDYRGVLSSRASLTKRAGCRMVGHVGCELSLESELLGSTAGGCSEWVGARLGFLGLRTRGAKSTCCEGLLARLRDDDGCGMLLTCFGMER